MPLDLFVFGSLAQYATVQQSFGHYSKCHSDIGALPALGLSAETRSRGAFEARIDTHLGTGESSVYVWHGGAEVSDYLDVPWSGSRVETGEPAQGTLRASSTLAPPCST